jgi:hypothetical protein
MFTLVQWDQRGAGKTYGRNGNLEAPMTIERMVDHGIELAQYLLDRPHVQKIILERSLEANIRPVVLFAPEFSLRDIYTMLQGSKFAGNVIYPEVLTYEFIVLGGGGHSALLTMFSPNSSRACGRWRPRIDHTPRRQRSTNKSAALTGPLIDFSSVS